MKKFLIKIILFSLSIVIPTLVFIIVFGFFPSNLSTSISFNSKIKDIKVNHLNDTINILSIGSSMALNNLSTKIIEEKLDDKYINISSWGQNIEEDFYLVKIFSDYYNPKMILLSSNYMDFNPTDKKINYNLVTNYLFKNDNEYSYGFKLKDLITYINFKYFKKHQYTNLNYDNCGGVNLEAKEFNVSNRRWKGNDIKEFKPDEYQYNYLDSISNYCKENGIKLIFIQSPFRNGYYSQLDKTRLDILNSHKGKIDFLLKKNKHLFIDSQQEKLWVDTLFVDYSHFNIEGAKEFTNILIRKVQK